MPSNEILVPTTWLVLAHAVMDEQLTDAERLSLAQELAKRIRDGRR